MEQRLLHTPEGVRDIYDGECERKLTLQNHLHEIMKRYGYRDIETPTFEFFDVFSREVGTTPSRDLYKFLTEKEIRWFCVRILLPPLQGRLPNISTARQPPSVSAMWEIPLLTIPATRDI